MSEGFVWYTLMTEDIAAAAAFYGAVVGWGTREVPVDGKPHTLIVAGEVPVGVIALRPEGARPAWLGFIGVDDVDARVVVLRGLGGFVHHPPTDISEVGRYAVVADPQGATFLLLHRTRPAPAAVTGVGRIAWHELLTSDSVAALAFYRALFGWSEAGAMELGEMGTYRMFEAGGATAGGMMKMPPQVPVPVWRYYIEVDAIDAAAERVRAGGGSVVHGPMQVPGGDWVLQGMDPAGAMFALYGKRV